MGPPGAVAIGEPPYYPDEYRLGIGTDLDGDGQLDPNEVEVWIGKCPFIGGVNEWWLEYINGVWYVHAVSEDPHTGRKRHYIYNTQTGMLKVFVEGGTMVYFGPATEYTGFGPVGSG